MIFETGVRCRVRKEGFSKGARVKKPIEFDRIIFEGAKKMGRNLVVYRLQWTEGQKFGVKIGRGIKRAVLRNKLKRVIREFLRKNKDAFAENEGVVVVCKPSAEEAGPEELTEELASLIRPGKAN
jgi:ribonuclease P protein component